MNTTLKHCGALLLLAAGGSLAQAADVGVSVSVSQPGFYGRIDIGRVPSPPVLVYQQPVVIVSGPVAVKRRPIYLHVPPGHAKDWGKHCAKYDACGQPVYFVQEDWYRQHYLNPVAASRGGDHAGHDSDGTQGPAKAQDQEHGKGSGKGQGKSQGKGEGGHGGHHKSGGKHGG